MTTGAIWSIKRVLEWTQGHFEAKGLAQARLEAQWIICAATALTRIELYTNYDQPLDSAQLTFVREAIKRRLAGEPLQYIVGKAPFRRLEFVVRAPVLIPRPETEVLVDVVLEELGVGGRCGQWRDSKHDNGQDAGQIDKPSVLQGQDNGLDVEQDNGDGPGCLEAHILPRVLDIGTGTGCIALSLLHEAKNVQVMATDVDAAAVELATENAELLGLLDPDRLQIIKDDLATSLLADANNHGSFDIVVSNPPYIPSGELEELPLEVARFESQAALDGGVDGLDTFRRIVEQACILLKPGGMLACELHENCLETAAEICQSHGLVEIEIHKDLVGKPRIITAQN